MKRITKRGMMKEKIGDELGLRTHEPLPTKLWFKNKKELELARNKIMKIKEGKLSEQQLRMIKRTVTPEEVAFAERIKGNPKLKQQLEDKIKLMITKSILNEIKKPGRGIEGAADVLNADSNKRGVIMRQMVNIVERKQDFFKNTKLWTGVSTAVGAGLGAASIGSKKTPAWSEWVPIHDLPGYTRLEEHAAKTDYFLNNPLLLATALAIPYATYFGLTARQMVLAEARKLVVDREQLDRYLRMIEEEEKNKVGYLEKQVNKSRKKGRIS